MKSKNETENWKIIFAKILKLIFYHYNLKDNEFAQIYSCDASNTKNWKTARSFPSAEMFEHLKKYIEKKAKLAIDKDEYLIKQIEAIFIENGYSLAYLQLKNNISNNFEFIIKILKFCIDAGKANLAIPTVVDRLYPSDGRTYAIIFDFDGTLTKSGKVSKTTWENIWISLGYNIEECIRLHKKFDSKEITHEEWCRLTEDKFKAKSLHRDIIKEISKKIKLIKGTKKTFEELNNRDIKIYIVSGSIMHIIQNVLGNLNQYVSGIKANQFMFDEAGYLTRIVGTKYDFEGKADYILQIADELKISTKDILFVGNSYNDQYAHRSGVRTLCINPTATDITNTTIWNNNIKTCNDLTDIFDYI